MSITDARTLPDHNHRAEFPAFQGCPACIVLGRVNPDTGTLWPSLDDHGYQVLADADRRFNDRYDGLNHEAALEAAVTEAYLRGRMQGRMEERKEARRSADGNLANALFFLRTAVDAAEKGDLQAAAANAANADAATATALTLSYRSGSGEL